MSSSDLLIREDAAIDPPNRVSVNEAASDISLAIYALERAYGGRNFIPKEQKESAIGALKAAPSNHEQTPEELCEKIGTALSKINDRHLYAKLPGKVCAASERKERTSMVGKNIHDQQKIPWSVHYVSVLDHSVPVLSVVRFPMWEDPVWNGFLEAVRKLKDKSSAIIIDLRGNGGGDDTRGREMAEILYGQKFPSPLLSRVISLTPETLAIRENIIVKMTNDLKRKGEKVPEFFQEWLRSERKRFESARIEMQDEEVELFINSGPSFDPKKGFDKPILLLIDADCASSCERTVDFFENHPRAVTVGENTGGFVHFGNMGIVLLPKSKIHIQMATDYWKYKDGRFIEGIGIAPKVPVEKGRDALEEAKTWLKKHFAKREAAS